MVVAHRHSESRQSGAVGNDTTSCGRSWFTSPARPPNAPLWAEWTSGSALPASSSPPPRGSEARDFFPPDEVPQRAADEQDDHEREVAGPSVGRETLEDQQRSAHTCEEHEECAGRERPSRQHRNFAAHNASETALSGVPFSLEQILQCRLERQLFLTIFAAGQVLNQILKLCVPGIPNLSPKRHFGPEPLCWAFSLVGSSLISHPPSGVGRHTLPPGLSSCFGSSGQKNSFNDCNQLFFFISKSSLRYSLLLPAGLRPVCVL